MLEHQTKEYHQKKSREWFERLTPPQHKERNKLRAQRRKEKKDYWVKQFGSKCQDCKQTFMNCVFDFHHIDMNNPNKIKPSQLLNMSDTSIAQELDKCVMICANCHRIRHEEDNYTSHNKRTLGYLEREYS